MALNIVDIPYSYFPDFNRGRPLFNASIYVGLVDTDPEIPANQKQVTVRQENGTEIEIAQPILTGSGGVPIYNGSPVTVLVDGSYSVKVLNSKGEQSYYSSDVTKGSPLTVESISGITNLQSSSVDNLILGIVIGGDTYNHEVGQVWSTGGTVWKINGTSPVIGGFIDVGGGLGAFPVNDLYMDDFGAVADLYLDGDVRNLTPTDNLAPLQQALALDYYTIEWGKGSYWFSGGVSITRGFNTKGKGARKRLPTRTENCTSLVFDLAANEDAFTYATAGFPEGDVVFQDMQIIHDISVLDFAGILAGKNRGIFGNDLVQGWFEDEKAGGNLLPTLRLVNVFFSGFWCGVDVHTWMSYFDGVRSDYCGHTIRALGTSLNMRAIWPQHPLLAPYQLRLIYSTIEASSLGETAVSGFTDQVSAMEIRRGSLSVIGCGVEKCDFEALFDMDDCNLTVDNLDIALPPQLIPKYIFKFTGKVKQLSISNVYEETSFSDAYMHTTLLSDADNVVHVTPLYLAYESQFHVYERIRNTSGGTDGFKGIFGTLGAGHGESQYLPVDSNMTNYDASHLFDNVWQTGDFTIEAGWTDNGSGDFTKNDTSTDRLGFIDGTSTVLGNVYYVEFTVTGGEVTLFARQGAANVEIGRYTDGTHRVPAALTESGLWFTTSDSGLTLTSNTINQNGIKCDVVSEFTCKMRQADRSLNVLVNMDGWTLGDGLVIYLDFTPELGINNAGASVVYPAGFIDGHVIASVNKNKTGFGINARSASSLQFGNPTPITGNPTFGDYTQFLVRADEATVAEKRGLVGTYKGWVRATIPSGSTGLGRFGVQIQRDPVA